MKFMLKAVVLRLFRHTKLERTKLNLYQEAIYGFTHLYEYGDYNEPLQGSQHPY